MRAALHGLPISINNALNPAICGSCYSYSGSNLSLVQAHQTQQSYNRVDLAQSDSSLAAKTKRCSRTLTLLRKGDREVQFNFADPGSCSSKRRQQGTSRQQQINSCQ